ncbi:hypothetical protein EDB86DRAFT_2802022, partial [Lactarius hatsudake]
QFCHSPSSWVALVWDGVVFPKGSVKVEARLVDFNYDIGVRVKGCFVYNTNNGIQVVVCVMGHMVTVLHSAEAK